MGLPITFILGAAILLLHDQVSEALPGTASLTRLLPFLLLLPLPWVLVRSLTGAVVRRIGTGLTRGLELRLRALPLCAPAAYAAIVFCGDLPRLAAAWAGGSASLYLLVALLPLLAMEVSYRLAEKRLVAIAARRGIAVPLAAGQLGMVWLVALPVILMAALSDSVRGHRWLEVFLSSTALGHLCGFLLTVLVLSFVLPLLFRWLLPTSRRLPPSIAGDVHATARALGFSSRAVLALRTDLRMANAAMVGPLPWPRYLVLTDALMALLDPFALRGVVAHEIGHARAGHPGLLMLAFVVVPVLSFHALWLGLHDAPALTVGLVLGALGVVAMFLLRLLAHRFEYEADQLSAAALGGALPCIEALRRVGQVGGRSSERSTLRHPADGRRIAQLELWARDEHERARFTRAGRRARWLIAAAVGIAAGACAWAQTRVWPIDHALLAYSTGDFPEARRRLDALPPPVPSLLADMVDELRLEVDAALALVPAGGEWNAVQDRLAEGGIERAALLLRQGDARAALPWLSLALSRPDPEPWRQTLYLIGRAAADGDGERLQRMRDHLASLSPPDAVWQTVVDLAPQAPANDRAR